MAEFTTETVYTVMYGKIVGRIGRAKICLNPTDPEKGRIVRDGREVKLIEGKWCYVPE